MNCPNLLIIGAMKSGTSSLHDYLSKHPDIYMSQPKEVHYYDSLSNLTKEGYLSYFKTEQKIVGTTPQSYTKAHHKDFQNIPQKIYKDTPNVKLIYIVRDPFERILSHVLESRFGDSMKRIRENESSGHYWKTSMYFYQISSYLKYFQKEQIHLLTLESLEANKLYELNKIYRFLGVDEVHDEIQFNYIKNEAASKMVPQFIKNHLWYRLLNKVQVNEAEKYALNTLNKKYKSYLIKPKLGSVINKEIVEQIREDALKLKNEFELDISNWNLNPYLGE